MQAQGSRKAAIFCRYRMHQSLSLPKLPAVLLMKLLCLNLALQPAQVRTHCLLTLSIAFHCVQIVTSAACLHRRLWCVLFRLLILQPCLAVVNMLRLFIVKLTGIDDPANLLSELCLEAHFIMLRDFRHASSMPAVLAFRYCLLAIDHKSVFQLSEGLQIKLSAM